MSRVHNAILVPSYGKDESKFHRVPVFEEVSRAKLFKMVIPSFRMAGKVKAYVEEHQIAVHYFGTNYNGYGYSTQNYWYLLKPKDAKVVQEMLSKRKGKKRKVLTQEEKISAWCRRLAKLTGISAETARVLAEEKLDDKYRQIRDLEDRQISLRYSTRRQKLIDSIYRSNPLRHIRDIEHASNILNASVRHNESDYEYMLKEARELADLGEIDHGEVKSYARQNTTYWGDVQSSFFNDEEQDDEE